MGKEKVNVLMNRCVDYFKDKCYTVSRISRYESLWRNGIVRYMAASGIEQYTPEVGGAFVMTCNHHGIVRPQEREYIRSVQVLDDMLQLGYIRKRCVTHVHHALSGEIGAEMEKLIVHITNLRRSQKTIYDYRLYLSEFLTYLNTNGISHVCEIAEKHVIAFIASHPTNKVNIVSALRVLFRFWNEEHIVDGRLEELFASYKAQVHERIPSYFTKEQVMKIEQSVQRSSGVGKRNYAMVLLASRLGLRASDIAGLKFSNIDWDRNLIALKMAKTGKDIELPLLADVGNAIADYLRHGRPKSPLKNVFLSSRAPYIAVNGQIVSSAVNQIICRSGIDILGKHHGPHSLRHSLAGAMLNDGTTLPIISETLGHRSTETTLTYLKIDIKSLLKCALPVPSVPEEFYMQRGGAFYG